MKVESTTNVGLVGTQTEAPVIIDGVYPVNDDGSVSIQLQNAKFSTAYCVTLTKADDADVVEAPVVYRYSNSYEAEQGQLAGGSIKTGSYTSEAQFWGPDSFISDNNSVLMKKGAELTYTISVPVDGKYELNFIYGNGTGTKRREPENSLSLNLRQSLSIDGGAESVITMKNTLLTNTTGSNKQYADLKAGTHTVKLKSLDSGEVLHDLLIVTHDGAYNREKRLMDKTFEAEQADFNTLLKNHTTTVSTKSTFAGYSGAGYVDGLTKPVTDGGGIRWNVVVDDSGLYNFTLRYRSESSGNANIYIGNTATTLEKKVLTLPVENTQGEWKTVTATAYLQKGINIVDADATVDICLDYMRVKEPQRTEEIKNYSTLIEAEDCIPAGAENLITVGESAGASGGKYVKKINGDAKAKDTLGKYLEFTYNAPETGSYEMQVFQSNDEICGTHGYNTKVIDKYMSFEVKDSNGNVLSDDRYFFMNTNSQDSFKEKTISLRFNKGENKIRVYNDDSWEVLYGGSQTEPGENRLVNTMPNVDKFIITPTKLAEPVRQEEQYAVNVRTTGGGYASADKNTVGEGGSFSVNIAPDSGIERVLLNGTDYTPAVSGNRLDVQNVTEDVEVRIYFSDIEREYRDSYIKNAGFGVGTTLYWDAKDVIINKNALNSYEGYYASLSKGSELSQTIKGIPEGTYNFSVYSKGSEDRLGKVKLKVTMSDGTKENCVKLENTFMCNTITAKVNDSQDVTISIDTSELNEGNVFLDNFSIIEVTKRDTSKVSDDVLYFVDAGDYYPDTLPDGEKFGIRNSSTEQIYSQDPVTGYYWGVLPSEQDPQVPRPIFSSGNAVYTKYMYPARWDMEDKKDKNGSYRQTYEQDYFATKFIRYAFELEPGEYVLTVGFQAMWGDRGERKIIANKKQLDSYTIPQNNEYGMAVRTFTIGEDENKLELSIEKESGNIWVNYLVIEKKTSGADVGALKTLCDSMNKITNSKDDPYTNTTWNTFGAALSNANAYLEPGFIPKSRQSAVDDAVKKLQSAYDGLVKQSDEILNPYDKVEAEYYSQMNGPGTENCGDEGGTKNIAYTANGHWLKYSNLDFTKGATKFLARIASNSSEAEPDPELELRLDSLDGEVIGTMKAEKNGEWQKYITVSCDVKNIDGMHDVYMVFKGPFNFNWFMFKGQDINPYDRYEAEDFSDKNGVNTENCGDEGGTKNVCWVAVGHWVKYESVGFTKGSKKFLARIACNSGDAEPDPELELRLDSVDGELIGTMKSAKNGEWQKYITVECDVKDVRGTHDVYMIFKGPFNFNWWKFVQTDEDLPTEQPSRTDEPSATDKPAPTEQPVPTEQPSQTKEPSSPTSPTPPATPDNKPGQTAPAQNTAAPAPTQGADNTVKPAQGEVYKIGNYKYKITNLSKKTASLVGVSDKKIKTIKVTDSVKIESVKFNVTSIGNKAFKGCGKAKKALIGKNITKIGKQSFYKCSGLKSIVIKSKKLKSAGAGCFKGVSKKAALKAPKKYLTSYKKLIWK